MKVWKEAEESTFYRWLRWVNLYKKKNVGDNERAHEREREREPTRFNCNWEKIIQ